MTGYRVVGALALSVTISATPAHIRAQQPERNTFNAERAVSNIFSAISRADTSTLRTLIDDDLRWILASSGAVADKRQLLAAAATGIPMATNAYATDSVTAWQSGDVAVADYRLTNARAFHDYRQVLVSRATDV